LLLPEVPTVDVEDKNAIAQALLGVASTEAGSRRKSKKPRIWFFNIGFVLNCWQERPRKRTKQVLLLLLFRGNGCNCQFYVEPYSDELSRLHALSFCQNPARK
jgi:hypothetical protein